MYEPDNNPFANVTDVGAGLVERQYGKGETGDGIWDSVQRDDNQQISNYQEAASSPSVPPERTSENSGDRGFHFVQDTCQCRIMAGLLKEPEMEIRIENAGKSFEGSSGAYIAYIITFKEFETRRRYSEFESLRSCLARLHPTNLIPPIPEKHALSDYASHPTRAKDDLSIIDHRKRMLQRFLNRLINHPILRFDHVLHRFLDSNASWSETISSPPISLLPKNPLKGSALNPAAVTTTQAYQNLPIPSAIAKLKHIEPSAEWWTEETVILKSIETLMASNIGKTNRRILKRLGELSADFADLGASYNAFSLGETGRLAAAMEKIGQTSDSTYLASQDLTVLLSRVFGEPIWELSQTTAIMRDLLRYRHQKALQYEHIQDVIEQKRAQLASLEKSELEAKRIEGALQKLDLTVGKDAAPLEDVNQSGQVSMPPERTPSDIILNDSHTSKKAQRQLPGFFIFGKINHALHGMIDIDPASTRRNNIGKTRESIEQLEMAVSILADDVASADIAIRRELDRYKQQERLDLQTAMKEYANSMIVWSQRCLEAWEEADREIERLP